MNRFKLLLLAFLFGTSLPVFSQSTTPLQLTASRNVADQDFGYAVDLDGDVAIVGAFRNSDGLILGAGAAFVYTFTGTAWEEEAMLEEVEPDFLNWFGWDVAISGDVMVVSSRNGDTNSLNGGDVSVFRKTNGAWIFEAGLIPTQDVVGDYGIAVEVENDLVAVGDPANSAVHLFRYNGSLWVPEQVLEQPNPGIQDQFGAGLSIDGDRVLVSAYNADDDTWNQAGRLYVYTYDGDQWLEEATLESVNSNNIANLGVSVAMEGDWIVAGAPLDKEAYSSTSGAVLIYQHDGDKWTVHSKLFADDGPGFYQFGSSVTLSGNRLAVGAENWFPPSGASTGKVYLYEYDEQSQMWEEAVPFIPGSLTQGANFGHDVAMQGDLLLVGAPEYDGEFDNMGAAFIMGSVQQATSISQEQEMHHFQIATPYPNPFSSYANFKITTKRTDTIQIGLFDVLGRKVETLFEGDVHPGTTHVEISGDNLSEGVYWIRVMGSTGVSAQSVTLIR